MKEKLPKVNKKRVKKTAEGIDKKTTAFNNFEVKELTTSFGMTINLGNYETARIDKSITISPKKIYPTQKEIEQILDDAKKFIRRKVIEEVKETFEMEMIK